MNSTNKLIGPRGCVSRLVRWLSAPRELIRIQQIEIRKLHVAYKKKVSGEMQLSRFDKGALTLLAEIQREHPSLLENA